MFQRKLIAVLGLVAMLAVTAGVSQASKSRVESMGLNSPTLSAFTDDDANIFFFPTSVVRQNNLVVAEVGNNPSGSTGFFPSDQSMTIVRNFPKFGAIGYQMSQNAINSPSDIADNLRNKQVDLIWGKAFTKVDFAVRLDATNSGWSNSTTVGGVTVNEEVKGFGDTFGPNLFPNGIAGDSDVEINTMGFTPAIAIHMANDNRFEAAVTYRTYSLDNTFSVSSTPAAAEEWADDGSASYALIARLIMNKGDKHTLIPAGWYQSDDLSWKYTAGGDPAQTVSADETYKSYGIGISDNMKVNDNNLLLWGVQVNSMKHKFERNDANIVAGDLSTSDDTESTTPIIFVGLETDATKWLKVRMGAHQSYFSFKNETVDLGGFQSTTKLHGSSFDFSLGTGIRWNNLDVDMTLNPVFPLSGGYILSGDQATPFTRVSAVYHF